MTVTLHLRLGRSQWEVAMYFDETILASLITLGLVIGFFVGVGLFIRKDIKDHQQ